MPYVLFVEDDPDSRDMLVALAHTQQLTCDAAGTLAEARAFIARRMPDLIVSDLMLPDGRGVDLFDELPKGGHCEKILMTGHASIDTAIEAMRRGATDYLVKPLNMHRLNSIFERVPRATALHEEIAALRDELKRLGRFGLMLGNSPPMQRVYTALTRVAGTDASVLLMGESGTGKELAAETVHRLSRRRSGPFLAVNCGAIAANLVESELFGHDKGSFTGAERQHKGYFERADGGTLFLDEITEMPLELQVKLLRVLETGRVTRLGSAREIDVDVRIVAATNRDPEAAIASGKLRADLYHRVNVFPIALPPLRERGDDIQMLANALLERLNQDTGRNLQFAPAALAALSNFAWPGNVRELRNFVQRASIFNDGDLIAELPQPILTEVLGDRDVADEVVTVQLGATLAEVDRRMILSTLARCSGVKTHAAEVLDISLKTIYNRLAEFDDVENAEPSDDAASA